MIGAVPTDRCLVLFTKPARPGRVKTRLVGDLTAAQAAELHEAFVGDVTRRLAGRDDFDLVLAWALEDGEAVPEAPVPGLLAGMRQEGATLGDRLHHALSTLGKRYRTVAALGSDHPHVPAERVAEAFERVEAGAPVVLGPAEDGGYYLVAVDARALTPEPFRDVPWSTGDVLAVTRDRCRAAGLTVEEIETGWDVDRPEDLERLARHLAEHPGLCPRTRDLLASWGRLPELA
jgi:uncharacterized protein